MSYFIKRKEITGAESQNLLPYCIMPFIANIKTDLKYDSIVYFDVIFIQSLTT